MTWRRATLLLAAVLFAWQLGGHDLWAPDEPYFAEGAREMVVDGHWIVPHVNGVVTPDKPPLFFWLIALLSLPLGTVNEWTARLPSVLAGIGTVALTMRLAARRYGPRTAALAGAVLATTFLFWSKARWSQTDALLCFLIWAALSAFEAFREGTAEGRRAGLLFWLCAALAVLTKGPVGFLLPLGIALTVLATERRLGRWRAFAPLGGPLLFVAVVGAWIALTVVAGPPDYSVWTALREHFVERGVQGMHHRQPPWYFLAVLPPNLMPWLGLVPGALLLAWRRRAAGDRLALVAAVFVPVFFSLSTEKRELYALPALPAFALLVAVLAAAVCGWQDGRTPLRVDRRWASIGHGATAAVLLAAGVALPFLVAREEPGLAAAAWPLAVILATTGALALALLARRRFAASLVATVAGVGVLYLTAVTTVPPRLEAGKSARPLAMAVKRAAAARDDERPILAYDLSNLPEPIAFYSDGVYTSETWDPAAVRRHLEGPAGALAVVNGSLLPELDPELRARVAVLYETELARRPVLLLTNRPGAAGAGEGAAAATGDPRGRQ